MQNSSLGCIIHINYNDCQRNSSLEIHFMFWMIFNLLLSILSIVTFRKVYTKHKKWNVLVTSIGFWNLSNFSVFIYDLLLNIDVYFNVIPPIVLNILFSLNLGCFMYCSVLIIVLYWVETCQMNMLIISGSLNKLSISFSWSVLYLLLFNILLSILSSLSYKMYIITWKIYLSIFILHIIICNILLIWNGYCIIREQFRITNTFNIFNFTTFLMFITTMSCIIIIVTAIINAVFLDSIDQNITLWIVIHNSYKSINVFMSIYFVIVGNKNQLKIPSSTQSKTHSRNCSKNRSKSF